MFKKTLVLAVLALVAALATFADPPNGPGTTTKKRRACCKASPAPQPAGDFTVQADPTTPVSQQTVMGSMFQTLGAWKVVYPKGGGFRITKVVAEDATGANVPATFSGVTLVCQDCSGVNVQAASAAASTASGIYQYQFLYPKEASTSKDSLIQVITGNIAGFEVNGANADGASHSWALTAIEGVSSSGALLKWTGRVAVNTMTVVHGKLTFSASTNGPVSGRPRMVGDNVSTMRFGGAGSDVELRKFVATAEGTAIKGPFRVRIVDPNTGVDLAGTSPVICDPGSAATCKAVFVISPGARLLDGYEKTVALQVESSAMRSGSLVMRVAAADDVEWSDGQVSLGLEAYRIPVVLTSTNYDNF